MRFISAASQISLTKIFEIGILTSLGYKNSSIISTYIFYILSTSDLSATVGFFTGPYYTTAYLLKFFKKIEWLSFVLACLITLIFSVIMQIVTYFKVQTINMIESLKSVE